MVWLEHKIKLFVFITERNKIFNGIYKLFCFILVTAIITFNAYVISPFRFIRVKISITNIYVRGGIAIYKIHMEYQL